MLLPVCVAVMTALPNRRLFKDRLQQAMSAGARAQRAGVLLLIAAGLMGAGIYIMRSMINFNF